MRAYNYCWWNSWDFDFEKTKTFDELCEKTNPFPFTIWLKTQDIVDNGKVLDTVLRPVPYNEVVEYEKQFALNPAYRSNIQRIPMDWDYIEHWFGRTYGHRLTTFESSAELEDTVEEFCELYSYKYGNLLLTEMQTYDMIDNYSKLSDITSDSEGTGTSEDTIEGKETITRNYDGKEINELEKAGKEKETIEKYGKETSTEIISGTEKTTYNSGTLSTTNGTNNANTLRPLQEDKKSGNDTLTYGNGKNDPRKNETETYYGGSNEGDARKDVREYEYASGDGKRIDTETKSFQGRKDIEEKEFSGRVNIGTAYDSRVDNSTEYTRGNIGVTTSAQMLLGERELSNFSTFRQMVDDFVREFSIVV